MDGQQSSKLLVWVRVPSEVLVVNTFRDRLIGRTNAFEAFNPGPNPGL